MVVSEKLSSAFNHAKQDSTNLHAQNARSLCV